MRRILMAALALVLVSATSGLAAVREVVLPGHTFLIDSANRVVYGWGVRPTTPQIPDGTPVSAGTPFFDKSDNTLYYWSGSAWTASGATWAGGTITTPLAAPAGNNCASIPYSFTSDTNTGLCTSAADTFNLYTAGVSRLSGNATALTSTVPINITAANSLLQWNGGQILYLHSSDSDTGFGEGALASITPGGGGVGDDNTAFGQDALNATTTGTANVGIGGGALKANTTGSHNTAVGVSSLWANVDGVRNTAMGRSSLVRNTSGGNNTCIGYFCLWNNLTGSYNVAIGSESLYTTTAGLRNMAIGTYALYTSTGDDNVAVGQQSMLNSTTANQAVAIGTDSLKTNTSGAGAVAIGYSALFGNTAAYNVGIGWLSLYSNGSTTGNTAVGYRSGFRASAPLLTANSNSTFIGSDATTDADGYTNVTVIGQGAIGLASNQVVLGNASVTSVLASGDGGAVVTAGGFKVGANAGASGTVVVKGSDGNNCNLVFEGGILTSETCP